MADFESVNEALIHVVKAMGGSKQVGPVLWPDVAPDAAQRRLLDCLNDDRPAHLTPGQMMLILRMARQRGLHDAMAWLLSHLGYAPTTPVEPRDEVAELQRQVVAAADVLQGLVARIERISAPGGVAAVHGAAPDSPDWVEVRATPRRVA